MEWIVKTFQQYPELAYLSHAGAGLLGWSLKFGKFSLGAVTGVSPCRCYYWADAYHYFTECEVCLFHHVSLCGRLWSGAAVFPGTEERRHPPGDFFCLQCLASLLTAYVVARFLGYDIGAAAGLLSGSQTISAVLGVATDAINQLNIPPDQKTAFINNMPVAYAVTYIFGTAGSAWLLASIGPKLLRVDLAAECKKLEAKMGAGEAEPGVISMARRFDVRAYRVTNENLVNRSVKELEAQVQGCPRIHPAGPPRACGHRSRTLNDYSDGRRCRCGDPAGSPHRAGNKYRT